MSEMSSKRVGNTGQVRAMPLWAIGLVAFLYTVTMAVLVQFLILPHMFPQWCAGHGLLAGGDWVDFHFSAAALADSIRTVGWSEWERSLEGIVGAIYAVTEPEPWVMIPINGAFSALAVIILVVIIESVVNDRRTATWCAVPFLFYPSALLWATQIHKDVFFIPGMLLVLYGWIILARQDTWYGWTKPLKAWIMVLLGTGLVWIVRPYGAQMILGTGVLMAFFLSVVLAVRAGRGVIGWSRATAGVAVVWCILASLYPISRKSYSDMNDGGAVAYAGSQEQLWTPARWMPGRADAVLRTMAVMRRASATGYPSAQSNIDTNVLFHCSLDVIAYIPRAAQIAFFAPFPSDWMVSGKSAGAVVMRHVSVIETIGVYMCLLFSLFALWRWRRLASLWLAVIYCFCMMVFYALVVCNVGTIYRVRYAFLMTWVALGMAGLLEALKMMRSRRGLRNGGR